MSVVCLREVEEGADDSVAPALQAAKEKLQRSQLEVSAPQRRQAEARPVDEHEHRTSLSTRCKRAQSPKNL